MKKSQQFKMRFMLVSMRNPIERAGIDKPRSGAEIAGADRRQKQSAPLPRASSRLQFEINTSYQRRRPKQIGEDSAARNGRAQVSECQPDAAGPASVNACHEQSR